MKTNPRIQSIIVARITEVNGKPVDGPRLVAVNYNFCNFSAAIDKGAIDLNEHLNLVSQSDEVCIWAKELDDIKSEFVNIWIRDYCDQANDGTIRFRDAVMFVREDADMGKPGKSDTWIQYLPQPQSKDIKPEELFLFSSSYGGDGIKLDIITDKKELFD